MSPVFYYSCVCLCAGVIFSTHFCCFSTQISDISTHFPIISTHFSIFSTHFKLLSTYFHHLSTNFNKTSRFPQPYLHFKAYYFSYSTHFSTLSTINTVFIHIVHSLIFGYPQNANFSIIQKINYPQKNRSIMERLLIIMHFNIQSWIRIKRKTCSDSFFKHDASCCSNHCCIISAQR